MSTFRELTEFEHESLEAFAAAHKRKADRSRGCDTWKEELSMVYWYNARIWSGPLPGMGTALHGIRNDFGPTWLYDVYRPRPKQAARLTALITAGLNLGMSDKDARYYAQEALKAEG